MLFNQIEEKIDELNKITPNSSKSAYSQYINLFWEIYNQLIDMENAKEIIIEPNKKHISYLKELLENDGPEYCYTIVFWSKDDSKRRYKIGVCVRGLPIIIKEN